MTRKKLSGQNEEQETIIFKIESTRNLIELTNTKNRENNNRC